MVTGIILAIPTTIASFWAAGKFLVKKGENISENKAKIILIEARVTAVELLLKTTKIEDETIRIELDKNITAMKTDIAFIRGKMDKN